MNQGKEKVEEPFRSRPLGFEHGHCSRLLARHVCHVRSPWLKG
jgi:hypothetical protein